MKMIEKRIRNLINGSENYELEFKSAKGGFPESFWQTFSAFANTNGGIIVLGIKHTNHKNIPDNLTEELINTYKKRFWDCAHNKEKVSATMLTERDVIDALVDGNRVLIFRIPRATYDIRPVYLNKNPFGNTYKRNHEGDYHCTETEIRQMFADAYHTTLPYDNQILINYSMEDIDIPTLQAYRQRFSLKKENHPWNELNDFDFLCKLGAYRIDRENGNEGFTRAGSVADFIIKGCDDNKWNHPTIEEKVQPDRVTMTFYLKETFFEQSVPSLSPVCPQSVLSLSSVCPQSKITNENVAKIVLTSLIIEDLSISSLMLKTGEKNKNRFRQNILNPLIEAGLIEPTIKDKPNSSKQAYRLTENAKELINS